MSCIVLKISSMDIIITIVLLTLFMIVLFLLWKLSQNLKPSIPPMSSSMTSPMASPVASPVTSNPSSEDLPRGCSLQSPWKFYTQASVDGIHGVDAYGNLSDPGNAIMDNWKSMSDSIDDQAYFLSPPYSRPGVFSWSKTVRDALDSGEYTRVHVDDHHKVLLVESPAKIVIGASTQLEGLVVRRGGSVLLCPLSGEEMILSLQFAIIESGGLLQCGYTGNPDAETDNSARLDRDLRLVVQMMNSSYGYFKSGVPCSQYPPDVLQPGATLEDSCCSDYTGVVGTCVTNATTTKSLAVLFNGNLHFAGHIPESVPYQIWRASSSKKSNEASYIEDVQLQIADGKAASQYSNTWTSVVGSAMISDTEVTTSSPAGALKDWLPGSQVVITSLSKAWVHEEAHMDITQCDYSKSKRGDENFYECTPGVMPFYVHTDGEDMQSFRGTFGVEICTIKSTQNSTITLTKPLQLNHARQASSSFTDTESDAVTVETPVHVGLLSRNIVVRGREKHDGKASATLEESASRSAPVHVSKNSSVESTMKALPRGKFNKVMASMQMEASGASLSQLDDQSTWEGPGGSIVCNRHAQNFSSVPPSIYNVMQKKNLTVPVGLFLHSDDDMPTYDCYGTEQSFTVPSTYTPRGSYLLGDSKCEGLQCILGGSVKIQYAAAFVFDGVELYQMGLPGNCGSLGQYSVHFHCAGWGPRFKKYAKAGASRHLRFCNSSNWRSYSRWLVLHGTNFAHVSNNVFCTCMGNGIFFEDGVEHNNSIEHNLMCNCVMTGRGTEDLNVYQGETQNPSAVIGNGGFDNYPVASIWLTNTYNFIFRNVICNNGTSGFAVWTIPVNPRTKSGPANLCTGHVKWKLPGLVGKTLIGLDKYRLLDIECVPDDMLDLFVTLDADGSLEALGNVKNFNTNPGVQTYVLFAENTLYSLSGGIVEANSESTVWARQSFSGTEAAVNYVPINGETSGELVSNNPQTYTFAASTPAKKESKQTQAQALARVFFQNRAYALYGVKVYQSGGFVWTQQGVVVGIGNCVLGGDHWSAGSSSKVTNTQKLAMGNFACIHVDLVTNCSLAGSGGMHLQLGCQGVLVTGSNTILGQSTCVGARTAVPPNAESMACIPQDDDAQPSFVMFGEGIHYTEGLHKMIKSWLFDYTSFVSLGNKNKPQGVYPALGGIAQDGRECCANVYKGNYDFLCDPYAESIDYVFVVETMQRVSYNKTFTDVLIKDWSAAHSINCAGDSVDLCSAGCQAAVDYAHDIYPVFSNVSVLSKWSSICRCAALSPGVPAVDPTPPSEQACINVLTPKGYNQVLQDCQAPLVGVCASPTYDTPQCLGSQSLYDSWTCPAVSPIKCTLVLR